MLKNISVRKKAVFAIASLIVLVRVVYIVAEGEIEKQYYTSANIETAGMQEIPCKNVVQKFMAGGNRLNKLELMFNGIAEDKQGTVILAITSENGLIYQTNLSLANINNLEWKQIFINIPMDSEKEYVVSLNAQDCTQVPNLLLVQTENASPEVIESFSEDSRLGQEIAVKYGYLSEPALLDRVLSSLLWVLFLAVLYVFLIYFERFQELFCKVGMRLCSMKNSGIILIVAELVLGMVIIGYSGIEFQEPTKIIFYLISVAVVWKQKEKYEYIKKFLDKTWKRAGLCILYFYGAFALVGQRILIYPLDLKITVQGLFVLVAAVLWFIPVVHTVIYGINWMSRKFVSGNRGRTKMPWFLGLLFLFLLAPAILNLYANNPGISSPDTVASMVTNAHHLKGMYDWHPFFYCMVLKIILAVWDSTYAVIFVQYFFWVYVIAEGLLYLRKKGMKDIFLLTVAFFSGSNAGNFIHLNTIWKDIPYTLSVLWVVILLAKLTLDFEVYRGKWYIYLELVVALTGTYFYRKNGVVTFAVIAAAMLIMLYRNAKVLGALAVTVALIFIVKGPIYSYFEVQDPGCRGMYIGLSQDILGVYYAGGEISEETLQMINVMTSSNNAEYDYTPTWSFQSYDLVVEPMKFVKNYICTFVKNPVTMARAVIAREDAVWNIFLGCEARLDCRNYTGTMDGNTEWNNYYPIRKYNSFYPRMSAFTSYTASSQWINALEWRCGIVMLVSITSLFLAACILKGGLRKYMVILAPSIGHILSLILSTGWSDFRYFWPLNLMNMFILLLVVVGLQEKENC